MKGELEFSMTADEIRHHERWDGNGYPDGLTKEEIQNLSGSQFDSEIADVFISIPRKEQQEPHQKKKAA